jgi:hypothetical protein
METSAPEAKTKLTEHELQFLSAVREAHRVGIGYGFMMRLIEEEWVYVDDGGSPYGPETFSREIRKVAERLLMLQITHSAATLDYRLDDYDGQSSKR